MHERVVWEIVLLKIDQFFTFHEITIQPLAIELFKVKQNGIFIHYFYELKGNIITIIRIIIVILAQGEKYMLVFLKVLLIDLLILYYF